MKNDDVLRHILKHCGKIQNAVLFFGDTYEKFRDNEIYQDAVSFSLAQIGELTTHLSADFKASTSEMIDWRSVKALRNMVVHDYETINFSVIWNIVKNDIPIMRNLCSEWLSQVKTDNEQKDDEDEPEFEP